MSDAYTNLDEKVEETEQVEETQQVEETEQVEETADMPQLEENVEETQEAEEFEEDTIVGPLFPPSYLRGVYSVAARCFRYFMDTKPKSS